MRRIKITLAYDGTGFHGWQVQPGLPTIQGTLENVLAEIEGAPVAVEGSGRTDAGVHALAQVASFSLQNPIPAENLKRAMNRLLPRSIRVLSVDDTVPDGFHARFQARAKTYEYRLSRDAVCSPFDRLYVYHYPYPLQEEAMIEAAGLYCGEHDFSAFAAADEKDALGHSKVRSIYRSSLAREPGRLVYTVRGSGFLKHMVRMMMGALIEVGKGNLDQSGLRERLQPGFDGKAGPSVPANGLFLVSVEYGGEVTEK